jgi:hypothetical protein
VETMLRTSSPLRVTSGSAVDPPPYELEVSTSLSGFGSSVVAQMEAYAALLCHCSCSTSMTSAYTNTP